MTTGPWSLPSGVCPQCVGPGRALGIIGTGTCTGCNARLGDLAARHDTKRNLRPTELVCSHETHGRVEECVIARGAGCSGAHMSQAGPPVGRAPAPVPGARRPCRNELKWVCPMGVRRGVHVATEQRSAPLKTHAAFPSGQGQTSRRRATGPAGPQARQQPRRQWPQAPQSARSHQTQVRRQAMTLPAKL